MGTFLSPDSVNVYMRFYLEIEEKDEQLRLLSSKKRGRKEELWYVKSLSCLQHTIKVIYDLFVVDTSSSL